MKKENKHKRTLTKTLTITIAFSLIVIALVLNVQLNGQSKIVGRCSYLDPWIIDLLAFSAALFLIVEGFARICEHPSASIKRQLTRMIRIALGCAILTLHIIQFLHK